MATPAAVDHWPNAKCAKGFWGQHDIPPYRELLADTLDWADPAPGERWLDLGCGGGRLARGLWEYSAGRLAQIVGVDCAAANGSAFDRLREGLSPPPGPRLQFRCHDFSAGL